MSIPSAGKGALQLAPRCPKPCGHPHPRPLLTCSSRLAPFATQDSHDAMYRSNAQRTGTNDVPLPSMRRWGGGGGADGPPPPGPPPPRDSYGGGYGGGYGRDDRGPPPRDSYGGGGGYGDRGDSRGGYDSRGGGGYGGGGGGGYDDRGRPTSRFDDRSNGGYDDRGRGPPPPPPSAGLPPPPPPPGGSSASPAPGERKRKSRWGDKSDAAVPVAITGGVQEKDLETYAGAPPALLSLL